MAIAFSLEKDIPKIEEL